MLVQQYYKLSVLTHYDRYWMYKVDSLITIDNCEKYIYKTRGTKLQINITQLSED